MYEESWFAPVSTPPPRFFNFGMPPANSPPNCGGCSIPVVPLDSLLLWSLLLRALFPPPGGFSIPGTGGAPANGDGPDPPEETFPTIGADRSFVMAFLSCFPFDMSDSKAPLFPGGGLDGRFPGGGGGGGGPPPIGGGGGGGGGGGMSAECCFPRWPALKFSVL